MTTTKPKRSWDDIMTESEYTISVYLLEAYRNGEDIEEALIKFHKNAISGLELDIIHELDGIMESVLFIKYSQGYRTQERWEKICRHRTELYDLIEYNACLSEQNFLNEWDDAFNGARKIVSIYFPKAEKTEKLNWFDVMEKDYHPDGD